MTDAPVLLQRANLWPLLLVNMGIVTHALVWYVASTAMPSAVQDLDAAAFISWGTSVYLVSSILGGALMAPAKSRFGARRAMLGAGLVVTAGGLLAAAAPAILLVLAGRALQGLGEGLLVALSYALVRGLFVNALVPRVFGTLALSWGIALMLGPLAGGWLTEVWSWRAAFIGAALVPVPMLLLGGWTLRGPSDAASVTRQQAPLLRILLLVLGVLAIAAADRLPTALFGMASVATGLLLVGAVLVIDRRRAPHLFPTAFPGLRHPASLGLWVLLLMPLAQAPVFTYIPYIIQMHRGFSPTMAGYVGVVHAIAWTVAAALVAPLAARWQNWALLSGPALLALGLAGLALTLATQPLALVCGSLAVIGVGFGVSNAFLSQRVMAAAQAHQEDATAGAIGTLSQLGGAVSAALAGIVGNSIGLDQTLTDERVSQAALALYGSGALLALLAACLALQLVRSKLPAL
jgi:predicted MFS family arabinose efflux permease